MDYLKKLSDPLFKNSLYLIISSIIGAGSGFLFWVIAARCYSVEDIGISSAIVSAVRMVSLLSLFGLDIALIWFLPRKINKSGTINAVTLFTSVATILFSIFFLISIDFVSPSLMVLHEPIYSILFILFSVSLTMLTVQGMGVFIADRTCRNTLLQNIPSLLRLALLPFFTSFGLFGIFTIFGSGLLFGAFVGAIILVRKYQISISTSIHELSEMVSFSLTGYITQISENAPGLLLPILIISFLDPNENAYFYVAWWIMFFTTIIARMTSKVLISEGSHDPETFNAQLIEGSKFTITITAIICIMIFMFAKPLLGIFGDAYIIHSTEILRILLVGSIAYAINITYANAMIVTDRKKKAIYIYAGISMLTLICAYTLLLTYGLNGVGYAWIIGNYVVLVGVIISMMRAEDMESHRRPFQRL